MELFVMRHGHAESEAPKDSLRPLSALGKQEVEKIILESAEALVGVQQLLVSPYLRAQQTAGIAAELMGAKPIETCDLITPGGRPSAVIQHVCDYAETQNLGSILLVSHQPLVGVLIDELCGLAPGMHPMATASLAAIDTDVVAANCCRLRWLRHVVG